MKLTEHQIAELAAIFDDVITSDSVAVQSAFQRLALLSSLARTEKDEPGPFATLLKKLDWAEHELRDLRREVQILQSGRDYSFAGENMVVDLGPSMATSGPYVYGTGSDTINLSGLNTISISPLDVTTISKLPESWFGNIAVDEITSITVK